MILRVEGTLIYTAALATGKVTSNDVSVDYETAGWFSGKHSHFGGNLQVLSNNHLHHHRRRVG